MKRSALTDWLVVLLDGLVIGIVLLIAAAGWVWWRNGDVTIYAVETPLFVLAALALFVGGMSSRPNRVVGGNPYLASYEVAQERADDRRNRMTFGLHVIFGGVWGMVFVFLLDWLRR